VNTIRLLVMVMTAVVMVMMLLSFTALLLRAFRQHLLHLFQRHHGGRSECWLDIHALQEGGVKRVATAAGVQVRRNLRME
jgi:hypothetical protein